MRARDEWFFAMRDFAKQQQAKRCYIHPRELTAQQCGQYRILGGTVVSWLRSGGPSLLSEREVLKDLRGWDGDPFIVIISDLLAAEKVIPLRRNTFAA
jgi:hypothetical protein